MSRQRSNHFSPKMDNLVVLGGSSPFTVELIEALRDGVGTEIPFRLVLHGRQEHRLENLKTYGRARLVEKGWRVSATTNLSRALLNAEIVIVQIRFGGLEGRLSDESVANEFGLPGDETLGPSGLFSALRQAQEINNLATQLVDKCPNAWIINLINPLSITTALFSSAGLNRLVGICELPSITSAEVASQFGLDLNDVRWSYSGMNHRGFLTSVRYGKTELIAQLPRNLGKKKIFGIDGNTISALKAVPLKYFSLLQGGTFSKGRAITLMHLRDRLENELDNDPTSVPYSMSERQMPWYRSAVVPILSALKGRQPLVTTVNIAEPDGIVREKMAEVTTDAIRPLQKNHSSKLVNNWIERFEAHERLSLAAIKSPCKKTIRAALQADPMVPSRTIPQLTDKIQSRLKTISTR